MPRGETIRTTCLRHAVGTIALFACNSGASVEIPVAEIAPLPRGSEVLFVGAGDIGNCASTAPEKTAQLLDVLLVDPQSALFTLGDNAYPDGSLSDFLNCYHPTWGRHLSKTHPAIGNHEYHVPHAGAYFAYFGARAGPPFSGYYSYDIGTWHVLVLNSNCYDGEQPNDINVDVVARDFGGCNAGSAQEAWVRKDLATHRSRCALAMWHHPRFSSGHQGNFDGMSALWRALFDYGVDVVLVGHDHHYERFAPQTADGTFDDATGIREFVVGTGGTTLRDFSIVRENSEIRQNTTHGVLALRLRPTSYAWSFVGVPDEPAFVDEGEDECH